MGVGWGRMVSFSEETWGLSSCRWLLMREGGRWCRWGVSLWIGVFCFFSFSLCPCLSEGGEGEPLSFGYVSMMFCCTHSQYGKKEMDRLNHESAKIRHYISEVHQQIQELEEKLQDPDYLDCVTPDAEEEIRVRLISLQKEEKRRRRVAEGQLRQMEFQFVQDVSRLAVEAAKHVAEDQKLSFIVKDEQFLYCQNGHDCTNAVVGEMDRLHQQQGGSYQGQIPQSEPQRDEPQGEPQREKE